MEPRKDLDEVRGRGQVRSEGDGQRLVDGVGSAGQIETPVGRVVMVGTDAAGYELIRFGSAGGSSLTGLQRGLYGTAPNPHSKGQRVLFARVIQIGQTGIVERVR